MRTVVAVLRGGPSREYDVSLKTGASVLEALDKEKYEPRDIFISRSGGWHLHGVEVAPERALFGSDVAFNALHGHFGEDGQVQRLLERLSVPYTGSGPSASATAFNKHLTKQEAKKLGIKTPHSVVVENSSGIDTLAHDLFRTFPHPAAVKPVAGGSGQGFAVAENFAQLQSALAQAFDFGPQVLVEEYIKGRDASVGVVNDFRSESTYALLPTAHELLSQKEKAELAAAAKAIHDGLKLSHYSESNFVVSKRGIYFLEVNSHPKLGGESRLADALQAVGSKLSDFLGHMVSLALNKKP
jgi:D-alanine--D-alanine ligase